NRKPSFRKRFALASQRHWKNNQSPAPAGGLAGWLPGIQLQDHPARYSDGAKSQRRQAAPYKACNLRREQGFRVGHTGLQESFGAKRRRKKSGGAGVVCPVAVRAVPEYQITARSSTQDLRASRFYLLTARNRRTAAAKPATRPAQRDKMPHIEQRVHGRRFPVTIHRKSC